MATFTAQERNPVVVDLAPGAKVPSSDDNGLRELGATEFYPRRWEYAHPKHTMRDVLRPGYFDGETRAKLMLGDEIHCTMCCGSKLPSEWDRLIVVVEEKPNTRELPLIIAILHRYKRPTPVRHAGEALDDDPPPPRKAA